MLEGLAALIAIIIAAFGLGGGDSNNQNKSSVTNQQTGKATPVLVSKASPEAIPTPALLPGLIGLGLGALRKRKSEEVETEA